MIDADGFRANVGIVICNHKGQVFWARRYRQNSWQYPQGGIDQGETPEQAMFRELNEEVGLSPKDVEILAVTKQWLRYKLPSKMVRPSKGQPCIGQKQKWFLLRMIADDSEVDLQESAKKNNCRPEFDDWEWVSYWYPLNQIVDFKRQVYQRMLKELSPLHAGLVSSRRKEK